MGKYKNDELNTLEVHEEYKKPNFLISAKYESTLIEEKIQAYSLSHYEHFVLDEKTHALVDVMKASELKKAFGGNNGSFYTKLKKTAELMTTRNVGYVDPETKTFDFMTTVIRARYEKGLFYVYYNPYLTDYFTDIQNKFTILSLEVMMGFGDIYSLRLYELIKSQCYYANADKNKDNRYRFRMSLSELKLDLGIVNISSEDTTLIADMRGQKHPDYDKAVEMSKEKKLDIWGDFERYALKPAVKEINLSKSGMNIEYDTVRHGRGGKVVAIIFTVDILDNEDVIKTVELTPEEKLDFLDNLFELMDEKISIKDYKAIAEAANYNMPLIEKMYALSKTQKVNNIVGWMINAIKEDYSQPVVTEPKKPTSWDFEQREIDFEELEARLLNN